MRVLLYECAYIVYTYSICYETWHFKSFHGVNQYVSENNEKWHCNYDHISARVWLSACIIISFTFWSELIILSSWYGDIVDLLIFRWGPIWVYPCCFNILQLVFGFLYSGITKWSKETAQEMIANIREAFIELLDENHWMDKSTRKVAREKALNMSERIGYPDFITKPEELNKEYNNVCFYFYIQWHFYSLDKIFLGTHFSIMSVRIIVFIVNSVQNQLFGEYHQSRAMEGNTEFTETEKASK